MKVICLFDVTETECHYSCETVRENSSGWLDKQSWGGGEGENGVGGKKKKSHVLTDLNTRKMRNLCEYN